VAVKLGIVKIERDYSLDSDTAGYSGQLTDIEVGASERMWSSFREKESVLVFWHFIEYFN
jgi:hypothetical protein